MADDVFVLPHMLEMYIPTQCRCGQWLDTKQRDKQLETVQKTMATWFGGFTVSNVEGGWVLESGTLAKEPVTIVYSKATKDLLKKHHNEFVALAEETATELAQEAVAYIIDGKMSFAEGASIKSCAHGRPVGGGDTREQISAITRYQSLEGALRRLPDKYDSVLDRTWSLLTQSLGYTRETLQVSMSGWSTELKKLLLGQKAPIIVARAASNFQVILIQLNDPRLLLTEQRKVIEKILAGDTTLRALFIVTDSEGSLWHLVNVPEYSPTRRRLLRRFRIESTNQPMRTMVEQLAGIHLEIIGEDADEAQIKIAHDRAFDVQAVTDTFYKKFKEVFEFTRANIQGITHKDKAQKEERIHLFTQQLFNRLLFLGFLDKKGWLKFPGEGSYFDRLWNAYQKEKADKKASFYNERLTPLFFEALNTPTHLEVSSEEYKELEDYSEGFALPTQKELQAAVISPSRQKYLRKIIGETPFLNGGLFEQDSTDKLKNLHVPDECFQRIFSELFAAFNFTVMESTPFDQDVAIDPEMLGRVFEELVVGRHGKGSYYTPKPIVSFMCHEALKGHLARCMPSASPEAIEVFVEHYDASKIKMYAEETLDALRRITVCDPACGSGAYLFGMLQELILLRAALFDIKELDSETTYARKLDIIHNNLYGTDLEAFAVNIARLRLWLSLIVEYEGEVPPPLPNLDFKIECGDSLLGPAVDEKIGEQRDLFDDTEKIMEWSRTLKKLKEKYLRSQGKLKELRKESIARYEKRIRLALQESSAKRSDGKPVIFWQVQFFEVFANGGFDVVLANPPYVRQENIKEEKKRLQIVFPEVYSGKADLFCFFYARAIEILRPGGMLVFISSNKWFKAGYGAGLRAHMKNSCRIQQIIDFNDLPVFKSAVAYPMIFVANRNQASEENREQSFLFTDVTSLDPPYPDVKELVAQKACKLPDKALDEKRWLLMEPTGLDKIFKMEASGVTVRDYIGDQIHYGIKTGFNEAFFIDGTTRAALIREDPRSKEIIKPLIQGKDVKKWEIESRDQWIVFAKQGIDIEKYPAVKKHLSQWKTELTPKTSGAGGKGRAPGSYKWYELQSSIAYEAKFSNAKIVYPVIVQKPCFAMDYEGYYFNDKAFMIPLDDLYLLGVLNSEAVWFYLKSVCSTLQNEFIELRSPYVLNIPLPNASKEEQAKLSKLVSRLLKAPKQRKASLEKEINAMVESLYGI